MEANRSQWVFTVANRECLLSGRCRPCEDQPSKEAPARVTNGVVLLAGELQLRSNEVVYCHNGAVFAFLGRAVQNASGDGVMDDCAPAPK